MVDISLCPKRVLEILSMIFSFLCYLMCSFQSSLFQVYLIILYLFSGLTGTPADPAEHAPIIRKYIKQNTGVAITLSFSFCQKMVSMLPATMFVFNLFFHANQFCVCVANTRCTLGACILGKMIYTICII